jgi:hypothetical protein
MVVVAATGFLGGLAIEHFRSEVWARQERWKARQQLYGDLFYALAQIRTLLTERSDTRALPLDPTRVAELVKETRAAYRRLRRAESQAAALNDPSYEIVRSKLDAHRSTVRETFRTKAEEVARRAAVLDEERAELDRRLAGVDGGLRHLEQRLEREDESIERLALVGASLEEKGVLLEQLRELNARHKELIEGVRDHTVTQGEIFLAVVDEIRGALLPLAATFADPRRS